MDDEYTGVLYPEGLPSKERLKTYASHFEHVEANASLYRTPQRQTVAGWVNETPSDFTFNVRLHRAFSEDPETTGRDGVLLQRYLDAVQPLIEANRLRAFLLVLNVPFGPKRNRLEELDPLVERLTGHLLAVELRNRGWVTGEQRDQTLDFFRTRQLVWIAVDMPRLEAASVMPPIDEVTNPRLAYLRLHGRNPEWTKVKTTGERHTYSYPDAELQEIARRVRALAEKADEVHVIANNHAQDFAPRTALGLKRLLA